MCHTDVIRNLQNTNGEFKTVRWTNKKLKTFGITMQKPYAKNTVGVNKMKIFCDPD